jgi:hypothetical protein
MAPLQLQLSDKINELTERNQMIGFTVAEVIKDQRGHLWIRNTTVPKVKPSLNTL